MKVTVSLDRIESTSIATFGRVLVQDTFLCYSLELPWRDNAKGASCIPEGTYTLDWRRSPKFGLTLEVKDVPSRKYILIHAANKPSELRGCIALGMSYSHPAFLSSSRRAISLFESLVGRYTLKELVVKNVFSTNK